MQGSQLRLACLLAQYYLVKRAILVTTQAVKSYTRRLHRGSTPATHWDGSRAPSYHTRCTVRMYHKGVVYNAMETGRGGGGVSDTVRVQATGRIITRWILDTTRLVNSHERYHRFRLLVGVISFQPTVCCEKNASRFEFSLCLSRACLGKVIISSRKWRCKG
eukprot:COSAG06_NODE_1275_length_10046_cov_4.285915_4_plen_162_part_00